jgi:alpha-beta hydrolase superfamily lysophospholipase
MGSDPEQPVADIVSLCTRVRADHEAVFCLAHSMGTLFTLPAVARMPSGTLRGVVLSGTVGAPGPASEQLMAEGRVPPESISRDPAVVEAYVDDPLVFERTPPELLAMAGTVTAMFFEAIPKITIPVLLIHGEDDRLCALSGAELVHTQLVTTDKTLLTYPGLYHEVLNEPEKDRVIADVVTWLDAHLGESALPS